jgi:uncharacterized membrane protein HdeD (DUF308 family)
MATGTMSSRHSWWMLAIRGIIALLFGLAVFMRPDMFSDFKYLFGAYAIIDGVIAAGTALDVCASNKLWWVVLLEGLVGIVFGILAMFLAKLLLLIAIWAVLMGILELASVFTMQPRLLCEWTMVIGGIVSLVLGIVLFFFLNSKVPSMYGLVGTFAIVFGVMMFARSVQFKSTMDMASAVTA